MRKHQVTLLALLTIFLSGCQSPSSELISSQRFIDFRYVEIDGRWLIDPEASQCFKREYKHSIAYVGPISKFKRVAFEECRKTTGYGPTDYVNMTNFQEEVRRRIEIDGR